MLNIRVVPIGEFTEMFPKIERLVKEGCALSPNDINEAIVKYNLIRGKAKLSVVEDGDKVIAINIVQPIVLVTGWKVLYVPITVGTRMDEWLEDAMSLAHQTAKELGCREIRGLSIRKGWLTALKHYNSDWYPIHEVIGCKVK